MSALSETFRGRVLYISLAVMMVAALAFFGPPSEATGPVEVEIESGVILLSTGPDAADNWVRYYQDPSGPLDIGAYDDHQTITVDKCEVLTDNSILRLTPSSRDVGLVNNGFGIRTKNNCATSNGQIDVSQFLTIGLGSDYGDFSILTAEVNIEGKQNADLNVKYDDGDFFFRDLVKAASDNGPDSGNGDNEIQVFAPTDPTSGDPIPFSSISFQATGNSKALVSVEGGGDGPLDGPAGSERTTLGVNQTLFTVTNTKVFAGTLGCTDGTNYATATDGTSASSDGPATSGALWRGDNVDPDKYSGDCILIPYTFEIQDDSVFFDFYDGYNQAARFMVKIVWDPIADPLNPPVRNVDYFEDGTNGFTAGLACVTSDAPAGATPSISYGYTHPVSDGTVPNGNGGFFANGEEVPVCLAGQELLLTSAGWQQIQYWDVLGDPRWN